eukprot:gene17075-biopygen18852
MHSLFPATPGARHSPGCIPCTCPGLPQSSRTIAPGQSRHSHTPSLLGERLRRRRTSIPRNSAWLGDSGCPRAPRRQPGSKARLQPWRQEGRIERRRHCVTGVREPCGEEQQEAGGGEASSLEGSSSGADGTGQGRLRGTGGTQSAGRARFAAADQRPVQ